MKAAQASTNWRDNWRDLRLVLRPFLAAQPRPLLLGCLLAALTVLTGMALLGLSGWFITATALAGLHAATAFTFDVFMPSAGIRLLALGRTASRYGERLVTHDATFAVLAALRVRLFRGWAKPGAARALLMQPARLLFRLTSDIDALESLYLRLFVPAAAALGAALLAGVVLGFMHVGMGVALALWLVVVGWGIAWIVASRARRPAVQRAHAIEALRARTVDLVAGQTDLVMAGRIDAQRAALMNADAQLAKADLALNKLEAAAGFAYGSAGTLTLVGVLLAVGALVGEGLIGVPAAALALLVALTATEPFAALRRGALDAGRTWLAVRRLAPRIAGEEVQAEPRNEAAAALRLEHVSFAHAGSATPVLRDISLTLGLGERVALIGASGAGKSTLLAAIAGEIAPQHGLATAQPACLLTQRTELFQDSLRDNLRLANPAATDDQLYAALQAAGLEADVRAMSAGLDTRLGEGGLGLSGGQSRRLALARLLLRPVPLWLLDEPTEALDAGVAHDVLQRLARHAGSRTVLIATHLRREAALADRLLCMRQGRIVADLRRGSDAFDTAWRSLRPD
ncbi:thiol reductant ABC exporter subunit CydC [Variovorax sp. J22G73]|uniref:thiol reductant ABC exporter subunit CydC n=1 Tax=unclassified Variovorax TaxID=663243 RepID=UPI0025769DB4|nr:MULTISPECIES: thiol reductant ABC exporter subunit CydC [unclassified Variovorax]MDM0005060.1 thiol reductant ABC exporter subunit CydC [Variovorax sp. J22R203]MDM0098476.1 thiol reductant ABC exporter subunit CydC [Variovorax sp. J22G73]